MIYDNEIELRLHERIRTPESASTVPGTLPVLFFGDLQQASIATVSLNPSRREYADRHGQELDGLDRRFETLHSLGASNRFSLADWQCQRAVSTMRGYFDPGRPVYNWFNSLSRVLDGMGHSYWRREAAHLDLVQEATDPTWSALAGERPDEAYALLEQDRPFLMWQLQMFPIEVLVCNGRTTLDRMIGMTGAEVIGRGEVSGKRTWMIAVVTVGSRQMAIAGWNIPLAQAPGLTKEGQVALGSMLKRELAVRGLTGG